MQALAVAVVLLALLVMVQPGELRHHPVPEQRLVLEQ
jgi:hypothetical protein